MTFDGTLTYGCALLFRLADFGGASSTPVRTSGFIDKFHTSEIARGRPVWEGGTGLFDLGVTFGGMKRLFFRGSPGAGGRDTWWPR
jgi:hypothetical protein